MSEFKEATIPKEGIVPEQHKETDCPKQIEADVPRMPRSGDFQDNPFADSSDVFEKIFKQYGLMTDASLERNEASQTDSHDKGEYSQYLEKHEDGRYYDKETGKAYDSVEAWEQAQDILAKRYEGTAKYYEERAKKEWARFKNAEANGETDVAKWEHYRRSQEYYAKAKECKEKAETIRARLSEISSSGSSEVNANDGKEHNAVAEAVVPDRQDAVRMLFDNAPDKIKDVVREYGDGIIVESTTDDFPICHYDRKDMVIRMEECLDDEEYAEILSHELGHYVDHQMEDISCSADFRDAIYKDLAQYDQTFPEGNDTFMSMIDDLMESDAAYDRSVTDNLSAFFRNDPTIRERFDEEGIDFYGHWTEYWDRAGAKECEIFANCFSMFAQNNTESCAFMAKYFPNTWAQFLSSL